MSTDRSWGINMGLLLLLVLHVRRWPNDGNAATAAVVPLQCMFLTDSHVQHWRVRAWTAKIPVTDSRTCLYQTYAHWQSRNTNIGRLILITGFSPFSAQHNPAGPHGFIVTNTCRVLVVKWIQRLETKQEIYQFFLENFDWSMHFSSVKGSLFVAEAGL